MTTTTRFLGDLVGPVPTIDLGFDVEDGWRVANPTIAADGDGFRVVVRLLNYDVIRDRHVSTAADGVFRTRNVLLTTDRDLAVTSTAELVPSVPPQPPVFPSMIVGVEDLRLVQVDDRWRALAAVRDRNPRNAPEMALLTLDGHRVESMIVLPSPRWGVPQKNWVPFLHDGALHLVQSCAPTVVLRADVATGACAVVATHPGPDGAERMHLRGGSQAIEVDDGWVFVAHEVSWPEGVVKYRHRFVLLDRSFAIRSQSTHFAFEHDGREFCAGMARRDGDLVVTYGVENAAARAVVVPMDSVLGMLEPVTPARGGFPSVGSRPPDDEPVPAVDPRALFALFDLVAEPMVLDERPVALGRPAAGPPQPHRTLTVAMATYDDFDGVYFTVQSLRLHHSEVLDRVSLLVLDNHPEGPGAPALKSLEANAPELRYVPCGEVRGTAVRNLLFRYSTSDWVMVVDSHVLFPPGTIARLLDWIDAHPDCDDLLQGPALWDSLDGQLATHFAPGWRAGMYGQWASDERGLDPDAEPFEIPMQGLGCFVARRASWLGFNPRFSGFGGEEGYIHEKYRQAGRRTLCLPFLRWVHRFDRPFGTRYENRWEDRIANYLHGWREVGLDEGPLLAHFHDFLGADVTDGVVARLERDDRSPFAIFDAIYCINLDERADRWAHVLEQAATVGIADRLRRLPAVRSEPNHHIGCALSHRRAIELASLQGLHNVLVLEDDVCFLAGAQHHLAPAVEELRGADWDLCYLGGHRWGSRAGPTPPFAHLERPAHLTTTHAVAYNARIFDRLLSVLPENADDMAAWIERWGAIDQYLPAIFAELEVFVTAPAVATQGSILDQEDPRYRGRFRC